MLKKSPIGLGALLALAAQALAGSANAMVNAPRRTGMKSLREMWTSPSFSMRSRSRRYPEQSSRQDMRRHRRAQGGPGIVLNPTTLAYEPRA